MIAHFGQRLADFDFEDGSAIVPIPLSKRRAIERGFNQAELIALTVAGLTDIPLLSNCLIRESHTPMHRMAMDKKAREATVKSAFKVRTPRLIAGRSVILVDDVLTSGSTASACARELKKHGAEHVTVITLARAVMYK
jgi:ComF family protein